jgi:bifunctional DNase/RNase
MEGIKTPRPMTQDLFKLLTDGYNVDVQEVTIHNVAEGIFYAKISTANMADNLDLECTVGDALSMAVLYSCPIFVSEEVMKSSSVDMNAPAPQTNVVPSKRKVPKKKEKTESIENLNKMLHDALESEDYETAVQLRDRIAKLKKV